MDRPRDHADALAESLAEACAATLKEAGFPPSDQLKEKLYDAIRDAVSLH